MLLESAVPPGTTENVLRPLLEEGSGLVAGRDFHLACSPSRLDPGNRTHTYASTPKVIGGLTPPAPSRPPPSTAASPTRSYGPGGRARPR